MDDYAEETFDAISEQTEVLRTLVEVHDERNELIREQNKLLGFIADSLEDQVKQRAKGTGFELTHDEHGRTRSQ